MNETVLQQIQDRLGTNERLRAFRIIATTESGVLVLVGRVPSYYHKQMAYESIRSLIPDGVRFESKIEVS